MHRIVVKPVRSMHATLGANSRMLSPDVNEALGDWHDAFAEHRLNYVMRGGVTPIRCELPYTRVVQTAHVVIAHTR